MLEQIPMEWFESAERDRENDIFSDIKCYTYQILYEDVENFKLPFFSNQIIETMNKNKVSMKEFIKQIIEKKKNNELDQPSGILHYYNQTTDGKPAFYISENDNYYCVILDIGHKYLYRKKV